MEWFSDITMFGTKWWMLFFAAFGISFFLLGLDK